MNITVGQWLTNIAITIVGVLPLALMLAAWTDLALWQVVCLWFGVAFLGAVQDVATDRGWFTRAVRRGAVRRGGAS